MASSEDNSAADMKAREANYEQRPSTVFSISIDVEGQTPPPPTYTERDNVASGSDGLPSYTQAQNQSSVSDKRTSSLAKGRSRIFSLQIPARFRPIEKPALGRRLGEPPPSYESVFGRVKQAKRESSGVVSFLGTTAVIILSTVGFTILLGIFMAIPVSMIVMGAIHLDNCPAERMIPIYLVVAGAFGAAKNLFSVVQRCRRKREELEEEQGKVNPLEGIVNCFMFGWFIAGCVWIYRTTDREPTDTTAGNYCDPTLYYFAFWITTAVYILMAASCCCMCTIGCVAALFSKKE